MPRACVLLAPGFEEIEAITVVDVLRRAGVAVATLGLEAPDVEGAHGIVLRADALLAASAGEDWDLVVLPGGMPGAAHLRDSPAVHALLQRQRQQGRWLAAICAAPIALAAAGVIGDAAVTCYPGFEAQLGGAHWVDAAVVAEAGLVTSRGPGTALAFALELVARLCGAEVAAEQGRRMLVAG